MGAMHHLGRVNTLPITPGQQRRRKNVHMKNQRKTLDLAWNRVKVFRMLVTTEHILELLGIGAENSSI